MRWLKRLGIAAGALAGLLLLGIASIYALTEHRFHRRYAVSGIALEIPTDSASLARGQHVVKALAKCGDCQQMTDEEIRAVYAFLKTVPPREFGNR